MNTISLEDSTVGNYFLPNGFYSIDEINEHICKKEVRAEMDVDIELVGEGLRKLQQRMGERVKES